MVRFTELSAARRGARRKLAAAHQGATRTSILATVVGIDPEDGSRLLVSVDPADPDLSVLAGPTKVVPGALVHVEVDSAGRPIRVLGPASTRPEGLDEDAPAPAPIVPMELLAPRELTAEEAQAIQDTADGLVQAQEDLSDAAGLLSAIGASDGPEGVAEALTDYLAIPLDQITVVDNRGADGQVIANLYDSIIVDGLLTASEIITGEMIADGAVTARTLNVVPEEGTGGVEILPPGLRIIPAGEEAGTAVSLRVDEPNWIAFAQDGVTTFSVSPEGGVVVQDIAVNAGLQYRGVELEERLSEPARGIIAHARNVENADPGTDSARLLSVTFRTPAEDRKVRVTIRAHGGTSSPRAYFHLRQAEGNSVTNTNSLQAEYYTPALPASSSLSVNWEHERTVSEWGWPYDATITLGVFVRSMDAGKTLNFAAHNHQEILVHDTGPAVRAVPHRPYIPATGGGTGGGTETQPGTREYTQTFTPTWSRSYLGNGSQYSYGPGRLYHGQYLSGNGILRSLAGFNRSAIQNFCSGAEMVRARVQLTVAHTYSSSGADFRFGYTANTSAPTTWTGSMTHFRDAHFTPGQYRSLLADNAMSAMKAGTFGALALNPGSDASLSRYGYVNASSVKLVITVRK